MADTRWRRAVWIGLAALAVMMIFFGEVMRLNSNFFDQRVGIGLRFSAILLIFSSLHWRKLGLPEPGKKQLRRLGITIIVIGVIGVAAFLPVFPWISDVTGLGTHLLIFQALYFCLIVVGTGLLGSRSWARPAAKLIAFPLSLAWPLGTGVAVYAWWILSPNYTQHTDWGTNQEAAADRRWSR